VAERIRAVAVASVAPSISAVKSLGPRLLQSPPPEAELNDLLALENERLRSQVAFLSNVDRYQELLADQLAELSDLIARAGYEGRSRALAALLSRELVAIPARVVFRPSSSWSHSLWIDAGRETNRRCGKEIVAKNSAVVVGNSLIGVVEEVAERRSRIRLVSDPSLHPAVRVVRGGPQDRDLLTHISAVQEALTTRAALFPSEQMAILLHDQLEGLKQRLDPEAAGLHLAKGVLSGTAHPHYRGISPLLRGEGFNYDYDDDEGPARDLRTGGIAGSDAESVALIEPGDLLVTSGLDGVLPAGLHVAIVHAVSPLQEGACCYSLTALPSAGDLNQIQFVSVLPPL
jgi:rod shape-determining protein MreC